MLSLARAEAVGLSGQLNGGGRGTLDGRPCAVVQVRIDGGEVGKVR